MLYFLQKNGSVCCIFHKPKAAGESSSESSDSSDDDISPLERMPKGLWLKRNRKLMLSDFLCQNLSTVMPRLF